MQDLQETGAREAGKVNVQDQASVSMDAKQQHKHKQLSLAVGLATKQELA